MADKNTGSRYKELLMTLWENITVLSVSIRKQYFNGNVQPNDLQDFLAYLIEMYSQLAPKVRGRHELEKRWDKWKRIEIVEYPERLIFATDGDGNIVTKNGEPIPDARKMWELYKDIREALEILGVTRLEEEVE